MKLLKRWTEERGKTVEDGKFSPTGIKAVRTTTEETAV